MKLAPWIIVSTGVAAFSITPIRSQGDFEKSKICSDYKMKFQRSLPDMKNAMEYKSTYGPVQFSLRLDWKDKTPDKPPYRIWLNIPLKTGASPNGDTGARSAVILAFLPLVGITGDYRKMAIEDFLKVERKRAKDGYFQISKDPLEDYQVWQESDETHILYEYDMKPVFDTHR